MRWLTIASLTVQRSRLTLDSVLGASLGNYRVLEQLGEGGMGVVYVGQHEVLGRRVAVKVLLPEMCQKAEMLQRFFNEARAATAINNPGIAQVFDFGTTPDGRAYIVMELLEGQTLSARLKSRRLDARECCRLGRQIANVLAATHAAGITHRDLKPDNLFLVPDPEVIGGERVKVLDFGIAKLTGDGQAVSVKTRTGVSMGTPSYMSPEQCRGIRNADARSDIYALGCILFKMACGRPPYVGVGLGDIVGAHLHAPIPDPRSIAPDVPPGLAALIVKMLAKAPDARPQTMTAIVQSLDELQRGLGAPAPVVGGSLPLPTMPAPRLPGLPPPTQPMSAQSPPPDMRPGSHPRAASSPPERPSSPPERPSAPTMMRTPISLGDTTVADPTLMPIDELTSPSLIETAEVAKLSVSDPATTELTHVDELSTDLDAPSVAAPAPSVAAPVAPENRPTTPYPALSAVPRPMQDPLAPFAPTMVPAATGPIARFPALATSSQPIGRIPVPQLSPGSTTISSAAGVSVVRERSRIRSRRLPFVLGGLGVLGAIIAISIVVASGDDEAPAADRPAGQPADEKSDPPPAPPAAEPTPPSGGSAAGSGSSASSAVTAPPVSGSAASAPSDPADDLASECRGYQVDQKWDELAKCAASLQPQSPDRAAEFAKLAAAGLEARRVAAFESALQARNLRRARAELDQLPPSSASYAALKQKYDAAEVQAIDRLAAELASVADSGCEEYQAYLQKEKATKPQRVLSDAARRTPCVPAKKSCNADALANQGRDHYAAAKHDAARISFEAAYACRPDAAFLEKAFISACNMQSAPNAKRLWKRLPPALRSRTVTICVRNGISEETLTAP